MQKVDQSPQNAETISLKEIYEKVITLETKVDLATSGDNNRKELFSRYVYIVGSMVALDVILSILTLINILER